MLSMQIIRYLFIGTMLLTNLLLANERPQNTDSQKNELSQPQETKELDSKQKPIKRKKSKVTTENPSPKGGEQEDAPPAPPVY
jgi:hypothetical protein